MCGLSVVRIPRKESTKPSRRVQTLPVSVQMQKMMLLKQARKEGMAAGGHAAGSCCPSASPKHVVLDGPPAPDLVHKLLLLHGMVGLQGPPPPPLPPEALGMPAPLQLWLGC